jgi:hypothetical protein
MQVPWTAIFVTLRVGLYAAFHAKNSRVAVPMVKAAMPVAQLGTTAARRPSANVI